GLAVFLGYLTTCALAGGVYRPRGIEFDEPAFYVLPSLLVLPLGTWWWERRVIESTTSEG
ncbi:MAG: hypothetical protein AAGA56_18800, partial [Myxococcota bacterium]